MLDGDSFTGYQSSPVRYDADSMTGFEAMATDSPKGGAEFPTFKVEPVPLGWDAVDDLGAAAIFNEQSLFGQKVRDLCQIQKKVQKKQKSVQKQKMNMTVFKPFESAESTELTVKMLRVWLNKSMPMEQMAGIDMMTATALGF